MPEVVEDGVRRTSPTTSRTSSASSEEYATLQARAEPRRLRRPARAPARPPARQPRRRRAAVAHLPLHHGRRVPGHEPAPGGDRARPRGDARQRDGGRRRQPEHLLVPRRDLPEHHGLPDALPGHAHRSKLEENYRSTQPILELANAIIDRAAEKHTEDRCARARDRRQRADARPVRRRAGAVALRHASASSSCARRACRSTRSRCSSARASTPSTSSSELQRADIPFVKRGGFKFIETAHVKDVLAHLRVVANPRDAVSWHRVLAAPRRPRAEDRADDLFDARRRPRRTSRERGRAAAAYPRRGAYTKELAPPRRRSSREVAPDDAAARREGGARSSASTRRCCATSIPRTSRSARRTSSTSSRSRRATGASRSLLSRHGARAADRQRRRRAGAAERRRGLLTLSTIHSAKGLEWRGRLRDLARRRPLPVATHNLHDAGGGRGGAAAPLRRGDAGEGAPLPDATRSTSTTARPAWCSASRPVSSTACRDRCSPAYRSSRRTSTGCERSPSNHGLERRVA